MSEYIVKIIPKSEIHVPELAERSNIINLIRTLGTTLDISEDILNDITFVDQGSNFESIMCDKCDMELEIDWWSEQMKHCQRGNFEDLSITTPCCRKRSSLNNLEYIWTAGFARYVISIRNPEEEVVREIERSMNQQKYKVIRAHY